MSVPMMLLVVVGCLVLGWALWVSLRSPASSGGFATARSLRAHGLDARGAVRKARKEYPVLCKGGRRG
jgi:hypothetical protein